MFQILSIEQACLKGTNPDLTILRSVQFQCERYSEEEHGIIGVLGDRDLLASTPEIGTEELYETEGFQGFE